MMRIAFLAAALAVSLTATTAMPGAAIARDNHRGHQDRGHQNDRWQGNGHGHWDPATHYRSGHYKARRLGREDHIYRGHDGRYYCRRSNGTTGLVIGGIAGGLLGHAVSGDTVGTIIGAGGGALLGKSIDQGKVQCR